mmetsp:Transcript_125678/g.217958  ORF Transcript_125678/g.217958 Transcript_125678/m.217958 type:complete len:514 (+) Transcript_125678:76-1617(+)
MASVLEMQAIEKTIADFMQDAARSSMEFPHLTAVQRKHAKKVLEQHPELTCDSYGLGKERKLHVFKKASTTSSNVTILDMIAEDAVSRVNVKNTFIDDWTSTEHEPIIFRSMPAHLPSSSVQLANAVQCKSPSASVQCKAPTASVQSKSESKSPNLVHCVMDGPVCKLDLSSLRELDCSTIAPSSCPSDCGSAASTSRGSVPDWFRLPPGLDVETKNTFVHFAESSLDKRAVKSMPHSMFRKSLLLESLLAHPESQHQPKMQHQGEKQHQTTEKQHPAEILPCQAEKSDTTRESVLMAGEKVIIEGLSKCTEFNGLSGIVQFFDVQSGRYNILLSSPESGNKIAMLKRENCRLLPLKEGTEVLIEGLSKRPAFNGLRGTVQSFDVQSGRYKILLSSPDFDSKTAMLKRENCCLAPMNELAKTTKHCTDRENAVDDYVLESQFDTGAEVVIEGLSKYPAFNGMRGTVQCFEVQSGRYNILLSTPVRGCKSTMVKQDNLRLISSDECCHFQQLGL